MQFDSGDSWDFSEGVVRKNLFVWTGGSIQAWKERRALQAPGVVFLNSIFNHHHHHPAFIYNGNFSALLAGKILVSWAASITFLPGSAGI